MLKEINAKDFLSKPFEMINDDWMLITAKSGEKTNTMTASWGGMGILWNKKVAFVFIRPQRYTFEFTEKEDKLSLTFFGGNKREALKLCGTKSGRDCDKIKEAGLLPLDLGDGYVSFEGAETVFLCRKIYADTIKPEMILESSVMVNYKANDFHKMYICEIEKILVEE